ncbi:MAG: polyamine aminopropyltransferase [Proteobacteria bacterium]|nr:polyamine aminopropyltransferase [Pseudomonadota bacterium]
MNLPPSHSPKTLATVLGLSMLFVGICGISYEYTFSKLASDILGNSVRQWAIIIGLMMFFMGVGADLQKYFPDRMIIDQFIFLEIVLGLLGGFGPTLTLYTFGNFHDHFILVHYFFICSIGLLIGLEIPLLTRVNQKTVPSLKHNLSLILKMDYIGSFIGALVWIFVLPKFFNLLEISYFLGILNVVVAMLTWFWFRNWMTQPGLIIGLAIGALVLLGIGMLNSEKISSAAEQKLYRDPIIFTETSPYQRVVVTQNKYDEIFTYINGHLQFTSFDEFIYHEMLVHPVMSIASKKYNVLVLGGGDGLAVREILKYKEVNTLTLVDIDPLMTKLAKEFPPFVKLNEGSLKNGRVKVIAAQGISEGERYNLNQNGKGFFRRQKENRDIDLSILNIDAYQFVASINDVYDIIIIDFPDPNNLNLSKLYSFEFYSLLKKRLTFDGLIIQQSTSPTFAKEAFLVIGRTLKSAGFSVQPVHQTVPSFGEWGWWIAGHEERYGANGIKQELSEIKELTIPTQYLTAELIKSSLLFGKNGLTSTNTDINHILDDKVYYHYQKAWLRMQ